MPARPGQHPGAPGGGARRRSVAVPQPGSAGRVNAGPAPATVAVVGGGIAGFSAVRELRRRGYAGTLQLIDPDGLPYDRPPLSKAFLAGTLDLPQLELAPRGWYADNAVEVVTDTAVKLDAGHGTPALTLASGGQLRADAVLLAAGARARRLPLPGMDLPGVLTLRSAADALALRQRLFPGAHLVIIGAGLVGAETASTARALGAAVTMVDPAYLPFERAAGPDMARYLHGLHAAHGTAYLQDTPAAIVAGAGDDALTVVLAAGAALPATTVLVSVGSEPETALAEEAGLQVHDGILVDGSGATSQPGIFAAGDSSRLRNSDGTPGRRFEHWDAARRTGEAAAAGILGVEPPQAAPDWFWSDRYGIHLEMAGSMAGPGRTVLRGEPGPGFMVFRVSPAGTLAGVAAVDGGTAVRAARKLIESGRAVDPAQLQDPAADLRKMARGKS
nr:FAD-dependent oxidoreductase [Arthrobacter sp. zg-Y20]